MNTCITYGHGFPPEAIERAQHDLIAAWRWRSANYEAWCSIVEAAHEKAKYQERISARSITKGRAPQRFAPIIARWIASEFPLLLPYIETHRSVFNYFTGSTHGRS